MNGKVVTGDAHTVGGQPAPGGPCHEDGGFWPTYAGAFQCIGASCEDPCCGGWDIPLDKQTYDRYRRFPREKLGELASAFVALNTAPNAAESQHGYIVRTPTGSCPFFTAERLCGIQKEYGAQLLSYTCSAYPRGLNRVGGVLEGSLLLSCPEAARNVLLTPDALEVRAELESGAFRTDYAVSLKGEDGGGKPYGAFHAVRGLLVAMVRDRSRPMWQRLLLIGSLCKRLDEAEGEAVPAILEEHRLVVERGLLREELDSWPSHLELKLRVVLRLTDERARDTSSGKRFQEVFWMFAEGIGTPVDAEPKSDVERYREAEQRYAAPFLRDRPYVLENFLLNYIFQNLFPFGRETSIRSKPQTIFEEYILMATQFAWIEALLVGVAGQQGECFAEEHVVWVVQSFCRAVEHNPLVLRSMNELMRHLQMDNLQGMSVMLRS